MKIGVSYPVTEVAGSAASIRKFVSAIDELGFDHMMTPDHVIKCPHDGREPKLAGPYTEKHPFHDPFVLFAFAAALSDRLEFATGVLILPQRQTALVAQQAADVDLLSNERLRLCVGIGWNHVEFAALGQDFRTRGKRVEEQIGLLRELWTNPIVTFDGRFDKIDRAGINPRPRRMIPLWVGGHSDAAYERAARIADGFLFASTAEGAVEGWCQVRQHLEANGRADDPFGKDLLAQFARGPEQAADTLKAWREAGGTHGSFPTTDQGLGADIDAHIAYAARVKTLVDAG
ncbi:LLM class F420-dependent oxidoreductase [Novosphingobium sp.]|uniref:LLM class F420-dependent oxidoreductase n=1 Tax=Novosphingobium sp. TaxID=1874826 RepID=UPI002FE2FEA4